MTLANTTSEPTTLYRLSDIAGRLLYVGISATSADAWRITQIPSRGGRKRHP